MHLQQEWVAESQTRWIAGEGGNFMGRTVPPLGGINATNVAAELVFGW
jgi:hypothetical protein